MKESRVSLVKGLLSGSLSQELIPVILLAEQSTTFPDKQLPAPLHCSLPLQNEPSEQEVPAGLNESVGQAADAPEQTSAVSQLPLAARQTEPLEAK